MKIEVHDGRTAVEEAIEPGGRRNLMEALVKRCQPRGAGKPCAVTYCITFASRSSERPRRARRTTSPGP